MKNSIQSKLAKFAISVAAVVVVLTIARIFAPDLVRFSAPIALIAISVFLVSSSLYQKWLGKRNL